MKPETMIDHPEGGRYNEVYRSAAKVIKSDGKSRSALTHIYFSLKPGEISRFHRVECDEVWNLYEGEGLILYLWDEIFNSIEKVELSKSTREYCHVVPAGIWQAATVKDEEVLVGCSVGPGFEFEDFRLMNIEERAAISLLGHFPDLKDLIKS